MIRVLVVGASVYLAPRDSVAQVAASIATEETGLPYFMDRYGSREYQAHRQNWAIAQTDDGVVWVGNTEGLLRFDGATWRRTPIRGGAVRSLAVGEDGRLFVGGVGTLGVVAASAAGLPTYVEIAGPEILHGADVWSTVGANGRIYFQTSEGVFEYDGAALTTVGRAAAGRSFHRLFGIPGSSGEVRLYLRQESVGLLAFSQSERRFTLEPGGEAFRDEKIWAAFGSSDGGLLVVTATHMARVNGGVVDRLDTPELTYTLERHRVYDGVLLGNGMFALGTLGAGVLIVNGQGNVIQRLNALVGLTEDDLVLDVAVDDQSGLWLALANGIVRIDAMSPLTEFEATVGLPGTVHDLARYGGDLYVGTDIGLYRLGRPQSLGEPARFQRLAIVDQTWSLFALQNHILVASTAGVYAVNGTGAIQTVTSSPSYVVKTTMDNPTIAYVGTDRGIDLVRRIGNSWRNAGSVEGVAGEVRSILEDDRGFLWAATPSEVVRIQPWSTTGIPEVVARYDLPDAVIANINGVTIVSHMAVRRPHADGSLVADRELTGLFANVDSTRALAWTPDASGRLWMSQGGIVRAYETSRTGSWHDVTPNGMRTLSEGLRAVLVEQGVLWLGTESGLLRYDLTDGADARFRQRGRVQISGVVDNHHGVLWRGGAPGYPRPESVPVPSGAGSIRIEFAAPAFNDAGSTRYRSRLRGYEDTWTSWGAEPWRDFTSLPPGAYVFEVEAVSGQGVPQLSTSTVLSIDPRWHETWWARFLFVSVTLLTVFGAAQQRVRIHRLRAEAEMRRANQFALMNRELQEADKLKDELLANTSHELRTPLTAILGYADLLTEYDAEEPASEVRETAGHILAGAHRLFRTVEDMMDAASIRAGRVELFPERVDVAAVVRSVADQYRGGAREKGLGLVVIPAVPDLTSQLDAFVDRRAFTRVCDHLIDNSMKFTETGVIKVVVEADDEAQSIRLSITDTGRGIDEAFIPHLFEPFKQQSTGFARTHEGNGLGLSIVGGLARLMEIELEVVSQPGVGTAITLRVPRSEVGSDGRLVSGAGGAITDDSATTLGVAQPTPAAA